MLSCINIYIYIYTIFYFSSIIAVFASTQNQKQSTLLPWVISLAKYSPHAPSYKLAYVCSIDWLIYSDSVYSATPLV